MAVDNWLLTLYPTSVPSARVILLCISRVIALPNGGRVETDVFESRLGRGETGRDPACCENNN